MSRAKGVIEREFDSREAWKTPTLTDLGFVRKNIEGRPVHLFRCSCGREKEIQLRYVLQGIIRSCGCFRGISVTRRQTTHGLRNHPLYKTHANMMRRCYDPRDKEYKNYGGRGIRVARLWHNLDQFINDMAPAYHSGLTLDRVDNNGPYSKANCQWATLKIQSRNKRSNVLYEGECAVDASIRLGGKRRMVDARLRKGWSREKAFTTPIKKI